MYRAPLISDPLQEHLLGRRGAIAVACVLSIAATIGQSFSKTRAQLAGCRVITGLTLAAKASIAPLLTAEIAPNHLRGKRRHYAKTQGKQLTQAILRKPLVNMANKRRVWDILGVFVKSGNSKHIRLGKNRLADPDCHGPNTYYCSVVRDLSHTWYVLRPWSLWPDLTEQNPQGSS
jgi:hypothetical protein